jgi:hypothetical protein
MSVYLSNVWPSLLAPSAAGRTDPAAFSVSFAGLPRLPEFIEQSTSSLFSLNRAINLD